MLKITSLLFALATLSPMTSFAWNNGGAGCEKIDCGGVTVPGSNWGTCCTKNIKPRNGISQPAVKASATSIRSVKPVEAAPVQGH